MHAVGASRLPAVAAPQLFMSASPTRGADCLFVLLVYVCGFAAGRQPDSDLVRLYRFLLNGYVLEVRPALNHSQTLNVTFGYSLTQIIDVDERNQILTTNAWINQNWVDYKLQWNPEEFGNITMIHLPHNKLWRPDLVLYNNADTHYGTAILSTDVFVLSNGNVTWLSAGIYKSSCPMNVRYYPFDEQECNMRFASWAYDGTKIDIVINSEEGDASNYVRSTEFKLRSIKVVKNMNWFSCCPEPFPDVVVKIGIRRRPMFYVFNLILPCVLITGVALLGFYMPSDSGEKVTLGITTLLSMTVFLMLVAESMPPTSETLPLIGMYYGVTICLVSLATAMTVFTLNIHHKGLRGTAVPAPVKRLVFDFIAKGLRIHVDTAPADDNDPIKFGDMECQPLTQLDGTELSNGGPSPVGERQNARPFSVAACLPSIDDQPAADDFEAQFLRVLNKVYATIQKNEARLHEQDRKETIRLEWQQVALVVDRFLLVCFVVTTTVVSLCIIYQRQLFFWTD